MRERVSVSKGSDSVSEKWMLSGCMCGSLLFSLCGWS